jgi:hypothetical protein
MKIVESFYEKFVDIYKEYMLDESSWEFNNNGYRMIVYFKYTQLHAVYQKSVKEMFDIEMPQSFIFDYTWVYLDPSGVSNTREHKQLFPIKGNIKSQLQFIDFVTKVINTFLSKQFDGKLRG